MPPLLVVGLLTKLVPKLIALRVLTPSDHATRREAVALLAERQCSDGGWNYGNASQIDVDLRAYAQTTAVALWALRGERAEVVNPGLDFLRRTWHLEPGGLTNAQALIAFRLYRLDDEARSAVAALQTISRRAAFASDPLSVAWAVLATGPGRALEFLGGGG